MNDQFFRESRQSRQPLFLRVVLVAVATALCGNSAFGDEIHTLVQRDDVEKAKTLLAANPSLVSSTDEHGWTPLYFAASQGHKAMVELLISNKADVNAFNQNFTPLRAAVLNHHPDVADLLLASGAKATIFDAAAGGYVELTQSQLNANPALVFATDNTGGTALQLAARNGQKDTARLLLTYGADVNIKTGIGMTPLQAVFAAASTPGRTAEPKGPRDPNYQATAELLIASGAEITNRNNTGLTALHYAAGTGFTNLIVALLERHADINAKDNRGRTPFDLAAEHGRTDVMQLLLARGAETDEKNRAGLAALRNAEKPTPAGSSSPGSEYEVDGLLTQTMFGFNGTNRAASASFTVCVRDCGWLIRTVETNENGSVGWKEVGSTNGTEIYECGGGLGGSGMVMGQIDPGNVPVGQLDNAVVGHLWLMFASKCYWPALTSDQLTPVYDWRASAAAAGSAFGNRQKVSADWELLKGPGSLPREVRYLDVVNRTNAIYTITGTNSAGGMLFPAGFVFQRFNGNRVEKRVEVTVTAIRPVCSRAALIPLPNGRAMIIDNRLTSDVPSHPPSYRNPVVGQWPTLEEARSLTGMQPASTAANLQRAGLPATSVSRTTPAESSESASQPELSLSIRCTNDVVKAGDEIDIEFRITNKGTSDYKYADRTYDRSGRMNEYKLVATNSTGEAVPDPRASQQGGWFGGGLFQYKRLKPGESYTRTIALNRWALVKEAGQYEVRGFYTASWNNTNSATVISDPLRLIVQPRTPAEMDAYINDLTNRLEAKLSGQLNPPNQSRPPDPVVNELVTKLMFTCSPRIVPSLLQSMFDSGSGGGFWEHEALTFYVPHSEETRQAILATATARGLGQNGSLLGLIHEYGFTKDELKPLIERALAPDNEPGWAAGAQLAQKFGDNTFMPRLIAIAKIPRGNGQTAAISALGAHRTDEGVKTLKSLLDDPHENIWTPLAQALQNGYHQGVLLPGDFTAQDVKPLVQRLMSDSRGGGVFTGISLLQQFGSDDYTSLLVGIATDSNQTGWQSAVYALAFNRTDKGLATLKSLLGSSDPQVRKMTEEAVRAAYTSRDGVQGKPLQPDDFDKQYQQPKAEK